jgi:glycosyltransferase involved in cell wall biosynthesis
VRGDVSRLTYLIYTETYPSLDPTSPRQTGIGRYCHDLAVGLVSLGERVTVLTNQDIGAVGTTSVDGMRVLARGRPPRSWAARMARGAALAALVRAERPAHLLLGDPAAHQTGSLVSLGAPYLPIFYGTELHAMRDAVAYHGLSPSRHLGRRLTLRYLSRADDTVCISRYTAGLLKQMGVRDRPGAIVYPCVSNLVLSRSPHPGASARLCARLGWADDGTPILLTVARISERKNQLGVLEALAHLHATSTVRYRYVMVGNVDAEEHRTYRQRLDGFANAHGLAGAVGWIEQASDEEKTDYLDGCDAFAMLSRTVGSSAEGFGISVIEASCRGKPVLVSDQGGMPETIREGETGFGVPPDRPETAARALLALADPGTRARMGEAGQAFARAEFTPRASAERLRRHLAERIGLSRSGR